MIELVHNFDPNQFLWLWAKYVVGFNEKYHCTGSIRGRYSKKFNKNNPLFASTSSVLFDEQNCGRYHAIYICGVSKRGYRRKENYAHNVHSAILPQMGTEDQWRFEQWRMTVHNGRFLTIPLSADCLEERYRCLSDEYTRCRIFRWAASFFRDGDSISQNN